jgi:hypothetical protein
MPQWEILFAYLWCQSWGEWHDHSRTDQSWILKLGISEFFKHWNTFTKYRCCWILEGIKVDVKLKDAEKFVQCVDIHEFHSIQPFLVATFPMSKTVDKSLEFIQRKDSQIFRRTIQHPINIVLNILINPNCQIEATSSRSHSLDFVISIIYCWNWTLSFRNNKQAHW